mmetsp:Transcript_881/g.1226  ORF Transcript_881/g.1226 Transcript_881/m.1226 type:complete len:215 (-) Transcript_881:93-737(-)
MRKVLSLGLMLQGISKCSAFYTSRSVGTVLTPACTRFMATSSTVMTTTPETTPPSCPSPTPRLFSEELNILYDSKCNVCKLEIDFLRRRDERLHGSKTKLKFTDLEDPTYNDQDPANGLVDYERGMKAMHGVKPNGQVVVGVPVFTLAYKQVRLGWLFGFVKLPVFGWLMDRGYDLFAKYRTHMTRGSSVESLVELHQKKRIMQQECETCKGQP